MCFAQFGFVCNSSSNVCFTAMWCEIIAFFWRGVPEKIWMSPSKDPDTGSRRIKHWCCLYLPACLETDLMFGKTNHKRNILNWIRILSWIPFTGDATDGSWLISWRTGTPSWTTWGYWSWSFRRHQPSPPACCFPPSPQTPWTASSTPTSRCVLLPSRCWCRSCRFPIAVHQNGQRTGLQGPGSSAWRPRWCCCHLRAQTSLHPWSKPHRRCAAYWRPPQRPSSPWFEGQHLQPNPSSSDGGDQRATNLLASSQFPWKSWVNPCSNSGTQTKPWFVPSHANCLYHPGGSRSSDGSRAHPVFHHVDHQSDRGSQGRSGHHRYFQIHVVPPYSSASQFVCEDLPHHLSPSWSSPNQSVWHAASTSESLHHWGPMDSPGWSQQWGPCWNSGPWFHRSTVEAATKACCGPSQIANHPPHTLQSRSYTPASNSPAPQPCGRQSACPTGYLSHPQSRSHHNCQDQNHPSSRAHSSSRSHDSTPHQRALPCPNCEPAPPWSSSLLLNPKVHVMPTAVWSCSPRCHRTRRWAWIECSWIPKMRCAPVFRWWRQRLAFHRLPTRSFRREAHRSPARWSLEQRTASRAAKVDEGCTRPSWNHTREHMGPAEPVGPLPGGSNRSSWSPWRSDSDPLVRNEPDRSRSRLHGQVSPPGPPKPQHPAAPPSRPLHGVPKRERHILPQRATLARRHEPTSIWVLPWPWQRLQSRLWKCWSVSRVLIVAYRRKWLSHFLNNLMGSNLDTIGCHWKLMELQPKWQRRDVVIQPPTRSPLGPKEDAAASRSLRLWLISATHMPIAWTSDKECLDGMGDMKSMEYGTWYREGIVVIHFYMILRHNSMWREIYDIYIYIYSYIHYILNIVIYIV